MFNKQFKSELPANTNTADFPEFTITAKDIANVTISETSNSEIYFYSTVTLDTQPSFDFTANVAGLVFVDGSNEQVVQMSGAGTATVPFAVYSDNQSYTVTISDINESGYDFITSGTVTHTTVNQWNYLDVPMFPPDYRVTYPDTLQLVTMTTPALEDTNVRFTLNQVSGTAKIDQNHANTQVDNTGNVNITVYPITPSATYTLSTQNLDRGDYAISTSMEYTLNRSKAYSPYTITDGFATPVTVGPSIVRGFGADLVGEPVATCLTPNNILFVITNETLESGECRAYLTDAYNITEKFFFTIPSELYFPVCDHSGRVIIIPTTSGDNVSDTIYAYTLGFVGEQTAVLNVEEICDIPQTSNFAYEWNNFVLAPNGKIYGAPYQSDWLLEIDVFDKTAQRVIQFNKPGWGIPVMHPNGYLYLFGSYTPRVPPSAVTLSGGKYFITAAGQATYNTRGCIRVDTSNLSWEQVAYSQSEWTFIQTGSYGPPIAPFPATGMLRIESHVQDACLVAPDRIAYGYTSDTTEYVLGDGGFYYPVLGVGTGLCVVAHLNSEGSNFSDDLGSLNAFRQDSTLTGPDIVASANYPFQGAVRMINHYDNAFYMHGSYEMYRIYPYVFTGSAINRNLAVDELYDIRVDTPYNWASYDAYTQQAPISQTKNNKLLVYYLHELRQEYDIISFNVSTGSVDPDHWILSPYYNSQKSYKYEGI